MQVDQKHSSAAPSSPEARSSEASSETAGGRSNSKRKRSGKNLQPGPRTVQNLTKEQLERKRENDRQAQRAIRTRTKIHIKELQDELEALRQNGDPQRIAELVQERDRLVRENRALKEELQQRSDMNHSPAQVHPVETSSGGSAWAQSASRPAPVGDIDVGHQALQSPSVVSTASSSTHSHTSGIQAQGGSGGYSPVRAYSRQHSYSQIPSEPVAARHAPYEYPARSTMNEQPPRDFAPRPHAPAAPTHTEHPRPTYPTVSSEGPPPQTAFHTGSSGQPRPTAFHHRRPNSPPGQHAAPNYPPDPQWTTDRHHPLPRYDSGQPQGGFYPPGLRHSTMEHPQQPSHPPQHEAQSHAPQYHPQPGYALPPPSASQAQSYPSGMAQYGPIGHYGHPSSQHYSAQHSPHPEQQRSQHGSPQHQPPGYFSYYGGP